MLPASMGLSHFAATKTFLLQWIWQLIITFTLMIIQLVFFSSTRPDIPKSSWTFKSPGGSQKSRCLWCGPIKQRTGVWLECVFLKYYDSILWPRLRTTWLLEEQVISKYWSIVVEWRCGGFFVFIFIYSAGDFWFFLILHMAQNFKCTQTEK